eukprot:SAG31_NODE_10503_length_1131_cov_0.840116_2_plen_109_part_01
MSLMCSLKPEKIAEIKAAFEAVASSGNVDIGELPALVRSLGGDYKWMKEAEIEEMAQITAGELAFVIGAVGGPPQSEESNAFTVKALRLAAAVGRAEHAAAMAAKKAAE